MQPNANPLSERYRAYRRRLVAKGRRQLIVDLPRETVAFIDELKERHGLRNRSQVLMQLIEKGRAVTQQQAT
jgi:metal-responsive CopG/Arc/MetJ family transcriptional regulator